MKQKEVSDENLFRSRKIRPQQNQHCHRVYLVSPENHFRGQRDYVSQQNQRGRRGVFQERGAGMYVALDEKDELVNIGNNQRLIVQHEEK
ncbi:hypothetical protein GL503_19980 [Salmonella enterica]|nr:hypothetical protein [Salmonella enterica]EHP5887330.1 hypothetical protein [Salmonella enterica]EIW3134549.1 hypothetical protein [Salmonella enterica]